MTDTDTDTATETAPDAAQAAELPRPTPAEPETDASGQPGPADDAEHQADADTFPRSVVEKLRRESATLRDRAQAAEKAITAAGLKPAAVWAAAELVQMLDDVAAGSF